jgi:hypothetical protein
VPFIPNDGAQHGGRHLPMLRRPPLFLPRRGQCPGSFDGLFPAIAADVVFAAVVLLPSHINPRVFAETVFRASSRFVPARHWLFSASWSAEQIRTQVNNEPHEKWFAAFSSAEQEHPGSPAAVWCCGSRISVGSGWNAHTARTASGVSSLASSLARLDAGDRQPAADIF